MDASYLGDVVNRTVLLLLHKSVRSLIKAIAWYSSTIMAGKEIACLEIILYATFFLLYTMNEPAARGLMARMIISTIALFESRSPAIPISVAYYFIFRSRTFESFAESLCCKLAVFYVYSYVIDVSEYLYMYAIIGLIAVGYDCYLESEKGVEDVALLLAVAVSLVQSSMDVITTYTPLVVFLCALFWGDRKLDRLVRGR